MKTAFNRSKNILVSDVYYFMFDATYQLAKKGGLPRSNLNSSMSLYRSVRPGEGYMTPSQSAQIPELSRVSDDSRYSGIDPDGKRMNAALVGGVYSHYSEGSSSPWPTMSPFLVTSIYSANTFKLKITKPISVALMPEIIDILMRDPKFSAEAMQFLKNTPLVVALRSRDHSVSRGVAHGVYQAIKGGIYPHRDLKGVLMTSERSDAGKSTVALFDDPILSATSTALPIEPTP